MKACGRGGWALFMFNRIGLATAPRADEIAPAVTRAQTLPSIPYWLPWWPISASLEKQPYAADGCRRQKFMVLVKEAGLKFSIVTHGATGSWLTMPLRSATLRSGEFR